MVGLSAAVWHELENGSYAADLPLWRELAGTADGPVLDLGAGAGRVAADLARRGRRVHALDSDRGLLEELRRRFPEVSTVVADARSFELEERFALVLAPMQLVQIVGGPAGRAAMLRCVYQHLLPSGLFAAALADPFDALPAADVEPPLPDILERDGWVFSSQPVSVRQEAGRVVIERLRQAVAPDGRLREETAHVALDLVSASEFEAEARTAGLRPLERRVIPETADHIGSVVVVCRR